MSEKGYFTIIGKKKVDEVKNKYAVMVKATSTGDYHVYWVDNKEQILFTGDLVLNSGTNLTPKYTSALIPSQANQFDEVFNGGLILGETKATVKTDNSLFIFYEPFCAYCKKLHKKIKPYVDKGLDVQFIPVSFLSPNSPNVIATLAKSKNINEDMHKSDKNQLDITERADDKINAMLTKNSQVMQAMNISGTPGIVYRTAEGKIVVARNLNDDDLERVVNELIKRNPK